MTDLYPPIEPDAQGWLAVGDGHRIYWEASGNPQGKPIVIVHGGPGSGASPRFRQLCDPAAYRIILFDQRNCGRSTPHASQPVLDLTHNTTQHLIADMERLRQHLGLDRWLVMGGSWGSTLALAYAVQHPECVSDLILFGVTTGRHSEIDWLFRGGVALFFPEQWEALCTSLPEDERGGDIVAAFNRRLMDPDPAIHRPAAEAWTLWESATPAWPPTPGLSPRFADPAYGLCFARIVTHYVSHNAFLADGALLRQAGVLADIPGILVNGRYDFQAPIGNAWVMHHAWPRADLVIVDDAGHSTGIFPALVAATDRLR